MKKLRYSAWLLRVLLGALLALPAIAKERAKPVMISSVLKIFSMAHNGETVMVMRNQDRSNRIVELYQPTYRGKSNPCTLLRHMATAAMAMGDVQIAARDGGPVPPGTSLVASG